MRKLSFKAGQTGVVCGFFLLQVVISSAFGQSAGTLAAAPAPPVDSADTKDSAPFGGCEPIGMTASGELVFPLECKHKIQLQPAPLASEEKTSIGDDKPVATGETNPAVVDAPDKAAGDKPALEPKAATLEDKPITAPPAASDAKPAAAETLAVVDKMPARAEQKPVEATPPQHAVDKAASEKPEASKAENAKAESDKSLKKAGRRAAGKQGAAKQVAARQVAAMAKPVAESAHVEEKSAAVRTAGVLPCAHYRSYNPASKSYRGFDGRMYACR
jgi:hypothetical protein